jgi:hypothetical protein
MGIRLGKILALEKTTFENIVVRNATDCSALLRVPMRNHMVTQKHSIKKHSKKKIGIGKGRG